MNTPDLSLLRSQLQQEIQTLQAGETSINQAKVLSNLANGIINSVLAEIMATKALPDNPSKVTERDYIDIE
jgi:hypothetical protein